MKKALIWTLSVVALAAAVAIGLKMRPSPPAPAAAPVAAPTAIELTAQDVLRLEPRTWTLGVPISGSLRAEQTAVIKAMVAGELQSLSVREGETVQAGQVIGRINAAEYQWRLQQAQQQAESARSQVEIAQRQFDNNRALVDQGFISKTALQTSQATLAGAQATYQAAQAAVELARKAVDDTTLKAPISGQVSQRLAQPGERVAIDGRVLEIVNLQKLELEAAVPAADAVQIRPGQVASLNIEGLAQPVQARVLRLNPNAQAASRQVLVYLGLNGQAGLRQGMFAQGSLLTRKVTGLAVPQASVRTDQPLPYVQVLDGEVVRHRKVSTGATSEQDDQTWVLIEGVDEGAQVLQGSAGRLRDGVKVRLK